MIDKLPDQEQPHAAALPFGGEALFKYPAAHLFGHTAAIIGDGQNRIRFINEQSQTDLLCFATALPQLIYSVLQQISQDRHVAVQGDPLRQIRTGAVRLKIQLDAAFAGLHHFADDNGRNSGGFDLFGNFSNGGRDSSHSVDNKILGLVRVLLLQISEDDMELVVVLVVKGAQGIHHLVGPGQLLPQTPDLRHVPGDGGCADHLSVLVYRDAAAHIILSPNPDADIVLCSAGFQQVGQLRLRIDVLQFSFIVKQIIVGIAQHPQEGPVYHDDLSSKVDSHNRLIQGVQHLRPLVREPAVFLDPASLQNLQGPAPGGDGDKDSQKRRSKGDRHIEIQQVLHVLIRGPEEHGQHYIAQKVAAVPEDRGIGHFQPISGPLHCDNIRTFADQHPILATKLHRSSNKRFIGVVEADAVCVADRYKIQIFNRLNVNIQIIADVLLPFACEGLPHIPGVCQDAAFLQQMLLLLIIIACQRNRDGQYQAQDGSDNDSKHLEQIQLTFNGQIPFQHWAPPPCWGTKFTAIDCFYYIAWQHEMQKYKQ